MTTWHLFIYLFIFWTQAYSLPGLYPGPWLDASFFFHIFSSHCPYFCSPTAPLSLLFPILESEFSVTVACFELGCLESGVYCDPSHRASEVESDNRKSNHILIWLDWRQDQDAITENMPFLSNSQQWQKASIKRHIASAHTDCEDHLTLHISWCHSNSVCLSYILCSGSKFHQKHSVSSSFTQHQPLMQYVKSEGGCCVR